ncbi:MAG: MATE family efflux transporter [Bacteroidales bacterium]|nr:MATE family efflux transporter [Bacteroidales bacterium]
MVDIAVAGHLHGNSLLSVAAFIGGISVGSVLFDLLYWNFAFLRLSTGGLVAQAFGRGDMKECAKVFTRSVTLALVLSVILLLLQWPFQKFAFLIVKSSEEVHNLALEYFLIRIWAAPATLSLMSFRGWFIGMQDSVSSMLTDLVVNIVNIVSSIILTLGIGPFKGFGFVGIAYGTVIAQFSGMMFAILVTVFKYGNRVFSEFEMKDFKEAIQGTELRRFMTMNGDLFIRSLCFIAIYFGFTTIAARYGDLTLSASTILMKILMLFSYITDGFAYAGEALTGRFIGAKEPVLMKRSVKYVFVWSMAIALAFILIYLFGGRWMLTVMSSDRTVVAECEKYLFWLLLMPGLGCAAFTWDGIYQGATATKEIRNAMLTAFFSFYAVYFIGVAIFRPDAETALHVLLTAYFAHLIARTVMLSLSWGKIKNAADPVLNN